MKIKGFMIVLMLSIVASLPLYSQCGGECLKNIRLKKIKAAMQTYTFRKFTFSEALEKTKALGIEYVEAYPGQLLDKDMPDAKFGHSMTSEQMDWAKKKLRETGLRLIGYGVVGFENTEAGMRPVFEFARKMNIEVITTEPAYDDYRLIEKMVREYNVKIAVHNDATPNKYALPRTVLDRVKGLDQRIGGGPDTGHWMRSGVQPVEGLRLLKGRVVHCHLKDLDLFGDRQKAKEVPFGSGKGDIQNILAELQLQGYDGYFSIEYERADEAMNPSPSIRKGLDYIKSITYYQDYEELLPKNGGVYSTHGWNHYGPGYFTLDEKTGELTGYGGMGLMWYSKKKFRDFILDLDYKCDSLVTNSGVFIRIPDLVSSDDYIFKSFEIQIDDVQDGIHLTGSVYDAEPPALKAFKESGEWNHYKITNLGKHITVELNGIKVVDWDAVPRGKIKEVFPEGYIGLQNHDSNALIHFKNIFIREL